MGKQVMVAAALVAVITGSAFADAGLPRLGSPDFHNSSPTANSSFGLSLAAMLIFGGYWVIRNPWAGLASFCLSAGIGLGLMAILAWLLEHYVPCVLFLCGGAYLTFWGGKRIFASRLPFVGLNLLFLLLSVGGGAAAVVSLSQLITWTKPPDDRKRFERRQEPREKEPVSPSD